MIGPADAAPRLAQRLSALERANEVRLARAELKRQVAVGELAVKDVLLDPPAAAVTWPFGDLLMCQSRWGATRVRKFVAALKMAGVYVHEMKPVGSMTMRQRQQIVMLLPSPRMLSG